MLHYLPPHKMNERIFFHFQPLENQFTASAFQLHLLNFYSPF